MATNNWGSAVGAKEFDRYAADFFLVGALPTTSCARLTPRLHVATNFRGYAAPRTTMSRPLFLARLHVTTNFRGSAASPRDYVAFTILARLHVATIFRGYAAPRTTMSRLLDFCLEGIFFCMTMQVY